MAAKRPFRGFLLLTVLLHRSLHALIPFFDLETLRVTKGILAFKFLLRSRAASPSFKAILERHIKVNDRRLKDLGMDLI
jgi:hypothetical protein